jgi:hypothetical protein
MAIIDNHWDELNSRYVLIGLNISQQIVTDAWINFHIGKHDRKLIKSCNQTALRGAYLTDLFKGVVAVSSKEFMQKIRDGMVDIDYQVNLFRQEMTDIKLNPESILVIYGKIAFQCYNEYFRNHFSNKVIKCTHYSDYSREDEIWVRSFWDRLGNFS